MRAVKNKIFIAGLLLAILATPYVAKPLHVHCHCSAQTEECAHEDGDCDNCPICHFTLSTFVEAQTTVSVLPLSFSVIETTTCPEKITIADFSFRHLRGPPCI
ncbi:MAG: hypothetical protein LBT76_01060 [Tannerella sp.]|jgi:hypothetical protein|nr:hypothetical protein [Tannerella sp.]